jgi:hypothetical protein
MTQGVSRRPGTGEAWRIQVPKGQSELDIMMTDVSELGTDRRRNVLQIPVCMCVCVCVRTRVALRNGVETFVFINCPLHVPIP